jgi:hypothetical protein
MIDMSEVKFGEPLLGYRFKPGDCIVNSDFCTISLPVGNASAWNQIRQWWLKAVVESNFEPCDHPEI